MKNRGASPRLSMWVFIGSVLLLSLGCGVKSYRIENITESPEHYVLNGFILVNMNRLKGAEREFGHALFLSPRNSPAYRGLGQVKGMKRDFLSALQLMNRAIDYAQNNEERALAYVGSMHLNIMSRHEGWLDAVQRDFAKTKLFKKDLPVAYYYMGLAFKYEKRFEESLIAFEKVLSFEADYFDEAAGQMDSLMKIEHIEPASSVGEELAMTDRITRGDMAALLIHELELERIFPKSSFSERPIGSDPIPADINNHRFREEIQRILHRNIQGLNLYNDGTFGPDEHVSRANYATIIADIVAKLRTNRYQGIQNVVSPSLFKDVPEDVSYYEAVMLCTLSTGLMDTRDRWFHPFERITGADAILTIHEIRNQYRHPSYETDQSQSLLSFDESLRTNAVRYEILGIVL